MLCKVLSKQDVGSDLTPFLTLGQAEAGRVVGENRGEAVVQGGGDCQRADRALDAGQEAMHHTLTILANHEIHYINC